MFKGGIIAKWAGNRLRIGGLRDGGIWEATVYG